ncbi:MAG TPA: energy transducer TonB [Acidobacteriaceae bacterium]|jgi:protein TonB
MFEGSLVASRGLVRTGTERWTALGSLTVQIGLAAALLTIPLVRPEVLQPIKLAPQLTVPLPVKPPVPLIHVQTTTAASSRAMSVPAAAAQAQATQVLTFHHGNPTDGNAPPAVTNLPFGPGGPVGTAILNLTAIGPGPTVTVAKAKDAAPTHVSGGVSLGLLLTPIQPVYPPIAKAVGIQGTVVLEAVISKAGRIESLHVVSGPDMLRRAATDAVQVARYRPYLLSGEPTEVQTTINVVFQLGR